jgi:hypothetical protein
MGRHGGRPSLKKAAPQNCTSWFAISPNLDPFMFSVESPRQTLRIL